jgi:hypothetical protein
MTSTSGVIYSVKPEQVVRLGGIMNFSNQLL